MRAVNPSLLGRLRGHFYLGTIIDDIDRLLELGIGDSEKLKTIKNTYENEGIISIDERRYVYDLIEKFQLDS